MTEGIVQYITFVQEPPAPIAPTVHAYPYSIHDVVKINAASNGELIAVIV